MKPLQFPLLLDENMDPAVLSALRAEGRDVLGVKALSLGGQPDERILGEAHRAGRVVVTHDRDFGTLAIRAGQPYMGIIYIRPGHIDAAVVLKMLAVLDSTVGDVESPFVLVVERRRGTVRVRLRKAP